MEKLRDFLASIILRRTHVTLNQGTLPPRCDVMLYCELLPIQRQLYDATVKSLLKTLGITHYGGDCGSDSDDEAEEDNGANLGGCVLPAVQQLRRLCTSAASDTSQGNVVEFSGKYYVCIIQLHLHLFDCCWQVLQEYLRMVKKHDPTGKVVIVSNFTGTLDEVQSVAQTQGWSFLRLDGSVPAQKRQGLVDSFNSKYGSVFLFLLSARAGGMGLSLVGANRLVMLDCDWNPATDRQALARIWRQGQTKPVTLVRMVAVKTIEEAIIQVITRVLVFKFNHIPYVCVCSGNH
jgi:SNF2 family DNA or RNA helicase